MNSFNNHNSTLNESFALLLMVGYIFKDIVGGWKRICVCCIQFTEKSQRIYEEIMLQDARYKLSIVINLSEKLFLGR